MSAESNYHSPLRDRAKHETRVKILEAVVRVVLDDGIHAFSVANVAKRAGISHRTVYRHFASREELLEGLSAWTDERGHDLGLTGSLPEVHDLPRLGLQVFEGMAQVREASEVEFIVSVALRYTLRGKLERWARLQQLVAETYPALTPEEQLEGAVALRSLIGSPPWFHLCVQLGLKEALAGRALSRAATLVIEDLARRNAEAAATTRS